MFCRSFIGVTCELSTNTTTNDVVFTFMLRSERVRWFVEIFITMSRLVERNLDNKNPHEL